MVFAQAPVWHYWIAVVVTILVVAVLVIYLAVFLRKTQSPRYPGNR
jgi:membrane protein implicated in regulation of membrane protease activity